MASVDPVHLVVGGAVIAGVYLVYKRGQREIGDYNYLDDLDPNWKGGKLTEAPTQLDLHTSKRPNCQKFDWTSYLFLDAGMPEADADQGVCFAKGGQRYVDKDSNISFPGGLTEVTTAMTGENTTQGTCYFLNPNGGYDVKPAQAIVNGSARLCFGAAGHHFTQRSNNLTYYTPQLSFEGTVPASSSSYCESLETSDGSVKWTHSAKSAPFDSNPAACAAASSDSVKFRYRDAANSKFVYQNPYTRELVQDPFH
jgi:hypothetical protein